MLASMHSHGTEFCFRSIGKSTPVWVLAMKGGTFRTTQMQTVQIRRRRDEDVRHALVAFVAEEHARAALAEQPPCVGLLRTTVSECRGAADLMGMPFLAVLEGVCDVQTREHTWTAHGYWPAPNAATAISKR